MAKILGGIAGAVVAAFFMLLMSITVLGGAANAANANTCDSSLQPVGDGHSGPGSGGDAPVFEGIHQTSGTEVIVPLAPQGPQKTAQWSREQLTNAATITNVARSMHLAPRAAVIAVAVAIQESSLTNRDSGDRDSVGLFQQRPSQGWGSTAQLTDPVYAATRFYHALLLTPSWQTRPLTQVASAVQQPAPDLTGAYAPWEQAAGALVSATWGKGAVTSVSSGCSAAFGKIDPASHFRVSNPRTPAQAVAAARSLAASGQGGWYRACEHFVTVVYGYSGGYATANEHWYAMVSAGRAHPGDEAPPPGALLYYDTGEFAGHVALYLGGDLVASTDVGGMGKVAVVHRQELTNGTWRLRYRGWTDPYFPLSGGT